METHSSADLIERSDEDGRSPWRNLGARIKSTLGSRCRWILSFLVRNRDSRIVVPTETETSKGPNENSETPEQFEMLLNNETGPKTKRAQKSFRTRIGLVAAAILLIFSTTATTVMWLTGVYDDGILKLVAIRNDIDVVYNLWKNPPTRPYLSVYIFNYTNYKDAIKGTEKLKVNEVGPFVYRERTQRINIRFNKNNTVSFQEKKIINFVPEKSNGSLNDIVHVPNVPLLASLNYGKDLFFFGQKMLSSLITTANAKPFENMTVDDFMWGHQDRFFQVIKNLSSIINMDKFETFGYLKKRRGVHKEVVTVNTGWANLNEVGEIDVYDGKRRIGVWGETHCDGLRASDGGLFPGKLAQQHKPLFVYTKDFCRKLPIYYYRDTYSADGFPVVEYRIPENLFDYSNRTPENYCFKYKKQFPPKGVFHASPCFKGVPVHVSFPHFWLGSRQLIDSIDGLKPDEFKHRSTFLIHERLGITLLVKTKFQLNIKLNKPRYISMLDGIEDGTILPIAWMEYDSGPLPEHFVNIIYHLTYTVRYIQRALMWLSLISLMASFYILYKQISKHFG